MVLISVKWLFMHFDSCHVYIFYIQLLQKRINIQINIWRNTFNKERVHVYRCGFLTSCILIDEVNNYTGVILSIACFDLNHAIFTCLDFWHRLSSIERYLPYFFLSYDVAVIQWLTLCHKNRMTTRYITLGYWRVTSWCCPWQRYVFYWNNVNIKGGKIPF